MVDRRHDDGAPVAHAVDAAPTQADQAGEFGQGLVAVVAVLKGRAIS